MIFTQFAVNFFVVTALSFSSWGNRGKFGRAVSAQEHEHIRIHLSKEEASSVLEDGHVTSSPRTYKYASRTSSSNVVADTTMAAIPDTTNGTDMDPVLSSLGATKNASRTSSSNVVADTTMAAIPDTTNGTDMDPVSSSLGSTKHALRTSSSDMVADSTMAASSSHATKNDPSLTATGISSSIRGTDSVASIRTVPSTTKKDTVADSSRTIHDLLDPDSNPLLAGMNDGRKLSKKGSKNMPVPIPPVPDTSTEDSEDDPVSVTLINHALVLFPN